MYEGGFSLRIVFFVYICLYLNNKRVKISVIGIEVIGGVNSEGKRGN